MATLPRRVLVLLFGATLLVVAACEARISVDIAVERDGSGVVSVVLDLDAEATEQLASYQATLATDDLVEAGWIVEEPTPQTAGALLVSATKAFAHPDELPAVIAEVSGPTGPLQSFRLEHASGFASASLQLDGTVNLTGSLEQFSDAEVAGLLDGFSLGRSPEEVASALAAHPEGLKFRLQVRLPYDVSTRGALGEAPTDSAQAIGEWTLGTEAVNETVDVHGEQNNRLVVVWLVIAGAAVALGVVLIVAGQRAQRRRAAGPPRDVRVAVSQQPAVPVAGGIGAATSQVQSASPVQPASPAQPVETAQPPVPNESAPDAPPGDDRPRWSDDDT